jgi:hypothetical protein
MSLARVLLLDDGSTFAKFDDASSCLAVLPCKKEAKDAFVVDSASIDFFALGDWGGVGSGSNDFSEARVRALAKQMAADDKAKFVLGCGDRCVVQL